MKTNQATINLVLNKQRVNKQGLMPIVLRVSWAGKRATKQTGIYVAENQWDSKSQSIKRGVQGFGTGNQTLLEMKSEAMRRLNMLVASGRSYTVDDVLSDRKVVGANSTLVDILEDMISYKGLSHNTAMAYRASVRRLGEAGVYRLSDVSADKIQGLCKRLKGNGLSDSSVNVTMACLGSIWKFGVDRNYCSGYLFSRFRHWKKYRIKQNPKSLPKNEIEQLLNWYVSTVAVVDQFKGEWGYSRYVNLSNRNSKECCIAMCLMCYQLQGIAFCDLVRIKSDNISIVEIEGKEYYCFSGLNRKKTNAVIPDIYVERTDDMMVLFEYFIQTCGEREGYLLPVLGGYGYSTKKQISEATGSCSVVLNKKLREVLGDLGYDTEDVSYYSFRHSFASHYMANPDSNPIYLATMMARSVNGIFRYVRSIESATDMIRERNKVYGSK